MKFLPMLGLSVSLFFSYNIYAVHAQSIRYNNICLPTEQRGNPDAIDELIFFRKPIINFAHVLATPTRLVTARPDDIEQLRTHARSQIASRRAALEQEAACEDAGDVVKAACARLARQEEYLKTVQYPALEGGELIAVPEQDIVFFMQWAERIIVTGDELLPVVTIILNGTTAISASSCCGDLPFVVSDHLYWQKVIEAGWVAVDADALGRVQPVLHTSVIGEKFHFYKTRYGVYFRETLAAQEQTPGDLLRIVKYVKADPRHNEQIHGNAAIIWLKFPSDKDFTPSLDGQYIPNAGRAKTASWVYAHDLLQLWTELNATDSVRCPQNA